MNSKILQKDLGVIEYKQAWDYQQDVLNKIVDVKTQNKPTDSYLLFCEHPHVYTLGRGGAENNLLLNSQQLKEKGVSFYKTNRGGDITYHGPGQIVGYPIIDLEAFSLDIRQYIYNLEEVIIQTLKTFQINSERLEGARGVWLDVNDKQRVRKICAIGVRSSRWVTMHGFALNVNTDLFFFNHINPCGFTDKAVTSMQKELGEKLNLSEVKQEIIQKFGKVFQTEITG